MLQSSGSQPPYVKRTACRGPDVFSSIFYLIGCYLTLTTLGIVDAWTWFLISFSVGLVNQVNLCHVII